MKKKLFMSICLSTALWAHAQEAGNVGIGTASPQTKLDIFTAGTEKYGLQHTNGTVRIRSWIGIGNKSESVLSGWIGTQSNHPLTFMVFDEQRAIIDTDGNFGINTRVPTEKLHVEGNIKMVDGNQGAGKVLTSDASGVGTWQTSSSATPAGAVFYMAANKIPTGYLECNGAAISRTTYAALFAVVGTMYGNGNGSTTFNLPDLRGEFIRGWDHGRGTDDGRAIGSYQKYAIQMHEHRIPTPAGGTGGRISMANDNGVKTVEDNSFLTLPNGAIMSYYTYRSGVTPEDYAEETRPRNRALMPVIKY